MKTMMSHGLNFFLGGLARERKTSYYDNINILNDLVTGK
jgi:hypothetical protein